MYNLHYCSMQGDAREINEDALLIGEHIKRGCGTEEVAYSSLFVAVADGMGGYAKGEVASYEVLKSFKESHPQNTQEVVMALMEARERLDRIALHEKIALGSAIAGVLSLNDTFLIFNVGDCRVYKIRADGEVVLLTQDHTLVHQLEAFAIDNVAIEQQKNVLTSAIIGGAEHEDFEMFHTTICLERDEKLLLCSDGFWNSFAEEIALIVSQKNPLKFVKKRRKEKNMRDDYSFIVIEEAKQSNYFTRLFHKWKKKII